MSDMTIEEARKIAAECGRSEVCSNGSCFAAEMFLEGHASRDLEVEKLKLENHHLHQIWKLEDWKFRGLVDELSAEREASRKLNEKILAFENTGGKIIHWTVCPICSAAPGHSPEAETL